MSKKPKRRAGRNSAKTAKLSPAALEQKARADLDSHHYRDAISGFKELLKVEPRPDWLVALADAYAGRARELSAKGHAEGGAGDVGKPRRIGSG